MRTAGLMMNDVWADRALRERGVEAHRYDGLEAEIGVLVDSVELKHKGKEENHRPYLHVIGELRSITPAMPLPYGITQVIYSHGQGEKVDAFYEFDDQQLVALAAKGYFSSTFVVPEQLTGIEWELPATVDALVLTPSEQQADAPVVFMNVHRIADLEIDLESSGYDLSDYFADHSKDSVTRTKAVFDEYGPMVRSDAINPLFTEDELALAAETKLANRVTVILEPSAAEGVSIGLQKLEADIAAEAEQFRAERESTEGTPENLYHERVAQALRAGEDDALDATDGDKEDRTDIETERGSDLDFGLESEERVKSAMTLDERKREASQRAADLDFGQDREHGLGS
jgi:hypothetical protein